MRVQEASEKFLHDRFLPARDVPFEDNITKGNYHYVIPISLGVAIKDKIQNTVHYKSYPI